MEQRPIRGRGLAGLLVLLSLGVALGTGTTGAVPLSPGSGVPLARGWGRFVGSGTLTAVGHPPATLVVLVASGRVEVNEGETPWRPPPVAGPRLVHRHPQTLVVDAAERPVSVGLLHPGDPVTVWGVVRPDAAVFVLTVVATGLRAPEGRATSGGGVAGVVVQRSGTTLELLTDHAARRSAVLTPATVILGGGHPRPASGVGPYDILRVEGSVNSDGSIAATRITVVFDAASAVQVSGPVQEHVSGTGGIVVNGTMVTTSAETYILHNALRATFDQIVPGRPVTVYGVPVTAGPTPVGVAARVVVLR